MNDNPRNERGLALGITLIITLVILGSLPSFFGFENGPLKEGTGTILTGIYIQFWGILYLLSYYYSHKCFFFRWLIWTCENISTPQGRKMAFFYFLLAFGLGTLAICSGLGLANQNHETEASISLPPGIEQVENFWYKDPAFYIFIFLFAVYSYYKYRKNNKK
jgi:hypothetical protein